MIKSVKKFYLFIAFLVCLLTLTSCIVVNHHEVHLEKNTYELMVGETVDAVAWVTKDADKVDVAVGYQSYDSNIATYCDGTIHAITAGEVRIKAYVMDNPDIYVVATVIVVDDISQTVEFTYSDTMIVGDTQTIQYQFAIESERSLEFTSSDSNVATVDENGIVTAKSTGKVNITTKVASLYQENSYKEYTLYIDVVYRVYPIVYELNGGINHSDNPSVYATEETPVNILEPQKLGFIFMGWYDNPECNGDSVTSIQEGTSGEVKLYAKWSTADYAIEYELNGGINHPFNPDGYTIGSLPITLEEPTKNGYTFIGWYQGTERITEIAAETTGNIFLEAKWRINTYTIEYDLQGGMTDSDYPNTYTVEKLPISLSAPTRLGYTFAGWLINGEIVDEISPTTTGNLFLIAKWEINTYTIEYDLQGGNAVANPTEYTIETQTILFLQPTKLGYTFVGWFNEDTKVEKIETGTTGNIYLTAKWEINTYYVSFTEGVASQEVIFGEKAVEPVQPIKEGYTFVAWLLNGEVFDFNTPITSNIELAAFWNPISYTITYQLDGGINSTNNPDTYNINTETIVLSEPTKEGYDFLGWYNNETKITEIVKGSTGDIILNSVWQIQTFTVTFTDNIALQEVEYGATIVEPASPSKIGYQFVSWQKDGIDFDFSTPIKEDVSLVANWKLLFENGAQVVLSTIRKTGNYFAMRSELTSTSTTRLVATDLGTSILSEIAKLASLDSANIWIIEYDEEAYYLKTSSGKYVSWTSGNSAQLSDVKYPLMITVNDDETYTIVSVSSSDRKLQLNSQSGNDYFAFYTSSQIGNIVIQDYIEPSDAEKLEAAVNALQVDSSISTTLVLENTSLYETTVEWTSNNSEIIFINDTGIVTIYQPENTTIVTLTAIVSLANGTTATKDFEVEVIGLPKYDHAGTNEDPYSVADAIRATQQLASNAFGENVVYVKGIVKSVSYNEQYDNYEIIIVDSKDPDVEFKLYRAVKGDTLETPLQNDTIIASGYIQNYNGDTPELSPNNNVNPNIEEVISGDSTIVFTYDETIVTINHSTTYSTNRLDRIFEITSIEEGYVIESVTVNGVKVEATEGVYSFVIMGDTEVIISTKENSGEDVQEKTYEYTFEKGVFTTAGGITSLNTVSWSYSTITYAGFDSTKGFQIGSKSTPTTNFTLSTSDIKGTIKSIIVNASIASSGTAKLSISVNDTVYLNTQTLTTTATDYSISPNISGEISISFVNTARAFYIKSITIIYEE